MEVGHEFGRTFSELEFLVIVANIPLPFPLLLCS